MIILEKDSNKREFVFGVGSVVRARSGVRDEEEGDDEETWLGGRVELWGRMFAICDGIVKVREKRMEKEGRKDGGMEGWRDGGMDGWMDGGMEG